MGFITQDQWMLARTALAQTTERFAEVLTAAPDPQARATKAWSIAVTAAHVTGVARLYAGIVDAAAPPAFPDLAGQLDHATVDTVSTLNVGMLDRYPERGPEAVAADLRAAVTHLLRASEGRDPDEPIAWIGGSRVPLAGILAHLLNEVQIHGRDIARASGAPWTTPSAEACLFISLFVVGVVRYGYGSLLDSDEKPQARRIAVQFRSPHMETVTMVLRDGRVTLEEPPGEVIDVRVNFDATTLNLVMFGRVSKPRAALTGKMTVGGRRPWLLPTFLRTVRMPS